MLHTMSDSTASYTSDDIDSSLGRLSSPAWNREREDDDTQRATQQDTNEDFISPAGIGNRRDFVRLTVFGSHSNLSVPSTPPMFTSYLQNEYWHDLRPRVAVINHDRARMTNNQGIFFDFFGGGDSPRTILAYSRRRILNTEAVESALR